MSLINDALKRARETQRNTPPPGAAPLPPVESPPRGGTGWILAVAVILFLAALCLFIGPTVFGHKPAPVATAKAPDISAQPPVEAALATVPAPSVLPSPASNTNSPLVVNTNPPPATVVVEQWPRVQGIIFNTTRPLAIVNGKTVGAGDRVGNYQVKQILKTSVVFSRADGSQKTLGIGE
jgi:hypothetical protein